MDSSSSQEQQHQNLQYHLSIQTKQQQITNNENLEQLSLPQLRTTDSLEVRDIPCLFHSFPQQIDSSFHRHHNNNNTNLHYHQSTIQYKQNNNRSLATRTSSASAFLCWRHRVFNFRYATSDNNQSSPPTPPHPSIICFASPMSTIYLFHLFPHSRYIHCHNNTKLTYYPPSLFPLTTYPSFQSYRFSPTAISRHSAHPTL